MSERKHSYKSAMREVMTFIENGKHTWISWGRPVLDIRDFCVDSIKAYEEMRLKRFRK